MPLTHSLNLHPLSRPLPVLLQPHHLLACPVCPFIPPFSLYFTFFFSFCVPLSKTSRYTRLRIMQTTSTMWCGLPCTPRSSPPWTAWVVWICGTWTTTLRWGNALGRSGPPDHTRPKMHQNNNKFLSVWASPHRPPLNQLSDSSSPTARTTLQRRSFPHTHSLQA